MGGEIQLETLRKYRKEKRYTREEVAEMVGIHAETLARYERGNRDVPSKVLKKMAVIFECTADDLLE